MPLISVDIVVVALVLIEANWGGLGAGPAVSVHTPAELVEVVRRCSARCVRFVCSASMRS
eukprot:3686178-Amphidinium_carterae.1